jgi:tetratricopeptide (TPR) repeat protein
MSIFEETGQEESITEGWKALELFTDRHEAIRLFLDYLHDDKPRKTILFFNGDGGNGKSLLLRFLREHCCKRLQWKEWERIQSLPDEELDDQIKQARSVQPVPVAHLDFGMLPRGEDRPQEAFSALLMLRRDLAGHALKFPLFDFAVIWHLHKTNQLTPERLHSLFPAEELGFLTTLVDAVSHTSVGALTGAVLSIFGKHLKEKFTLYKQQHGLDEKELDRIRSLQPKTELLDELPRLFAKDLNAGLWLGGASNTSAPQRVVLFFDTHEAFWGKERDFSDTLFFQRDEWLRRLLGTLEFSAGIVAVVAGRDLPRWHEAGRFAIPEQCVQVHLIEHLSDANAGLYLERAKITGTALRDSLVAYARVKPDQVHPLHLGLLADVVLAAERRRETLTAEDFSRVPQFAEKNKELIGRLLRYVDKDVENAAKALSACRAFNRDIFFTLGEALHLHATEAAFEVLTAFKFVWPARRAGEEAWYTIHDLLRRLLRERDEEMTRRADAVLEDYYRKNTAAGDVAAVAEAIYHANRRDWERGVSEWTQVFDAALQRSLYGLCGTLLEVRNELSIDTSFWQGMVSQSEGSYFATLSRHKEAEEEYREAIAAYDAALKLAPDDIYAHNNKGNVLQRLGALQAQLTQHEQAQASYQAAIAAYDAALKLAPDYIAAHNNKGLVLQSLGILQATLGQLQEACASFRAALAEFVRSLQIAPRDNYIRERRDRMQQIINELCRPS